MTQKKSVCRDAEQNLLVVTQKNLLVVTQKKSACRDAEKITRPVNTTGREWQRKGGIGEGDKGGKREKGT